MKNYLGFFLIVSGFLFGNQALAQVDDTRHAMLNVRATATVTDNLQMLTIRNLDLINPAILDKKILVSPITSGFAGMFEIIGNANARIRITFLQNEVIKEQNEGLGQVAARYTISEAEEDTQFQSTLLDVSEANVKLSDQGRLYIWLGASLDLANATPGLYLSEFTIELEYIQ